MRAAASSMASGTPSSLRQMSATSKASSSPNLKAPELASARSTNSCTAGNPSACGGREPRRCRRARQRRQAVHVLAFHPQRLAARRQDLHTGRVVQHLDRQSGAASIDVLAVVEHEQHPPAAQGRDRIVDRIARAASPGRARPRARPAPGQGRAAARGRRNGRRARRTPASRLATARATVVLPMPPGPATVMKRWCGSCAVSAATLSARSIMGVIGAGRSRHSLRAVAQRGEARLLDARDRGDKAIAAPGDRRQVAIAAAAVAQRPPQPGDLDLEVAVLDEGVRPDPRHELALADQLAGALDQGDQDLQGAAAQTHRPAGLQQQPSRREQVKRAERDRARGLGGRPVGRRGSILVGLEAGAKAFGLERRRTACIGQTLVNHRVRR